MVIEWLEIRVSAENRERYIQVDDDIWTPALQQYDGFIAKETWISPADPELLILMIRWETRDQWKAIPEEELTEITQQFDDALGCEYTMAASKEYQVRRFPVSRESTR
ncbi:TIGR03792 family protein [Halomicronema sp. CCY15110]|uniref:TIGR03792 family protein n=1 Tax=Halomicronema sp. CCY15110 TaxID=2767773 RepID=UPI001950D5A1|nr:TIGR03792 family protein [Halomicronema sp. CCY15110]